MVRLASFVGLMAAATCTIAAPSTDAQDVDGLGPSFSFEDWVNGIIADPGGKHLSPEEAVQAFNESGNQTQANLRKRADVACNNKNKPRASLADSVSCINQLAARGSTGCHIPYGGAPLITVGLAQIYGVTINHAGSILPCQTFAASAGRILDICVRPGDTTVQGSNYPNQNIEIHLGLPV